MELISFLKQFATLSPAMEEAVNQTFQREEYSKNYKLLLPKHHSKKIFFMEKGLARMYYLKEEGKDVTHLFFDENAFIMPADSVFSEVSSPYGVEILEPSVIYSASYPVLEKHIEQYEAFNRLMRLLLIDSIKTFSSRLYALQFQTAQERYRLLLEAFPNITQRAPLGDIASYLGITQQTLSVIRAQR